MVLPVLYLVQALVEGPMGSPSTPGMDHGTYNHKLNLNYFHFSYTFIVDSI